jgi:hypothetical protein
MPADEAVYALTSGYIARLSGLYSLPRFEPHITVLGGVSMPEMVEMQRDGREPESRSKSGWRARWNTGTSTSDACSCRAYKTDALMEVRSRRPVRSLGRSLNLLSPFEPGIRGPASLEEAGDDRGTGADPRDRFRSARDCTGAGFERCASRELEGIRRFPLDSIQGDCHFFNEL